MKTTMKKLSTIFKTRIDDLTDDQLKRLIRKRKHISLALYLINGVIAAVLIVAGTNGLFNVQGFPSDSQLNATSLLALLLTYGGITLAGILNFRIGNAESLAMDARTETFELQLRIRDLERKLEAQQL